jgi:hypothetical protein
MAAREVRNRRPGNTIRSVTTGQLPEDSTLENQSTILELDRQFSESDLRDDYDDDDDDDDDGYYEVYVQVTSRHPNPFGDSEPEGTRARRPRAGKCLFVCCDGTWKDAVSTERSLTNVARLARCVRDHTTENTSQVVYYCSGVGTNAGTIVTSIREP